MQHTVWSTLEQLFLSEPLKSLDCKEKTSYDQSINELDRQAFITLCFKIHLIDLVLTLTQRRLKTNSKAMHMQWKITVNTTCLSVFNDWIEAVPWPVGYKKWLLIKYIELPKPWIINVPKLLKLCKNCMKLLWNTWTQLQIIAWTLILLHMDIHCSSSTQQSNQLCAALGRRITLPCLDV